MKIKANKILAVLCVIAMIMTMIVPMTLTATAAEETWTLVKNAADLAVGDQIVIAAANANYALSTTQNNNNRAQAAVTKSGDTITVGDTVQKITLEAGTTAGTFAFNTGSGYLYAASSSKNYLKTEKTLSANSSWNIAITSAGVATIKSTGSYTRNWLRYNSSNNPPIFSCYSSGQTDVAIYKLVIDDTGCEHDWVLEDTTPATCTAAGEEAYTCSKCGEEDTKTIAATGHAWDDGKVVTEAGCTTAGTTKYTCGTCGETEDRTVLALGHNVENGYCKTCGEKITEATITFDNTAKRTDFSNSIQVWEEDGITVTNNKSKSTTNVADYCNPARFYKNSEIIVEGTSKIATIVFNCSDSSDADYASALKTSIGDSAVISNNTVVTVTLDGSSNSFTVTLSGGQVRLYSIKVVYAAEEDPTEDLNKVEASMSLAYKYAEEDGSLVDSMFVFKCAVDASLANIEGVDAYGIAVTVGEKTVFYTSENATSWKTADDKFYVSIRLGDIINNTTKLGTEFKVRAFVTIDDVNYYSELDKTYSVASAVKEYYTGDDAAVKAQVEDLYNILNDRYGLYTA